MRAGAVILLLLLGLAACGQAQGPQNTSATAPSPTGTGPVGTDTGQASGNGAHDRFIVCPGDPRCPPEGSQPKGRQPD